MISPDRRLRNSMWIKAQTVEGYDPTIMRLDACGAWIKYDMYGMREHTYGWEIEHIVPCTKLQELGIEKSLWDHELNLRPTNCANCKSKGNSFPLYTAVLKAEADRNTEIAETKRINATLRAQLSELYPGLQF